MARRSTNSSGSRVGAPWTWLRKPISAYIGARLTPDRAACRFARTSCALFPIDETIPMPVTTTRVMDTSEKEPPSAAAGARANQADAHVGDLIYPLSVRLQPTVCDRENKLTLEDALEVDAIDHFLDGRNHHVGEFDLADSERPAATGQSEPTEEEAGHLPQCVKPEAARHYRIAFEMAAEKPKVGFDVEFGAHNSFAVRAAGFADLRNPVEHQHRRQRQLGVSGPEQLAARAGEQILIFES